MSMLLRGAPAAAAMRATFSTVAVPMARLGTLMMRVKRMSSAGLAMSDR